MGEPADESVTISPRRRLLEEVLSERSKAVAGLPIDEQEPPAGSPLWRIGAVRLAARTRRRSDRRAAVRDLCVMALAWLEAIDRELPADRGAGGQQDTVG